MFSSDVGSVGCSCECSYLQAARIYVISQRLCDCVPAWIWGLFPSMHAICVDAIFVNGSSFTLPSIQCHYAMHEPKALRRHMRNK